MLRNRIMTSSYQVFRLFGAFRFGKEFRSLFNSSFVVNHGSRKSVSDIFGKSFPNIVNGISFSFTSSISSGSIALEKNNNVIKFLKFRQKFRKHDVINQFLRLKVFQLRNIIFNYVILFPN